MSDVYARDSAMSLTTMKRWSCWIFLGMGATIGRKSVELRCWLDGLEQRLEWVVGMRYIVGSRALNHHQPLPSHYPATDKVLRADVSSQLPMARMSRTEKKFIPVAPVYYSFELPLSRSSAFVLFLKFLTNCRTPRSSITSSLPPGIRMPGTSR